MWNFRFRKGLKDNQGKPALQQPRIDNKFVVDRIIAEFLTVTGPGVEMNGPHRGEYADFVPVESAMATGVTIRLKIRLSGVSPFMVSSTLADQLRLLGYKVQVHTEGSDYVLQVVADS